MQKTLAVVDLGTMEYTKVLQIQEELAHKRLEEQITDTLILVQHPPVITLGVKARDRDLKLSRNELEKRGISICKIIRGGAAFMHNPGQLVGYPIRLVQKNRQGHYVQDLLDSLEQVTKEYQIAAMHHPQEQKVGIWYNSQGLYKKIAAIGIYFKSKRDTYVTLHGFALNVCNDTKLIQESIYMCGCEEESCISLTEILNKRIEVKQVQEKLLNIFIKRLDYKNFTLYSWENFQKEVSRETICKR